MKGFSREVCQKALIQECISVFYIDLMLVLNGALKTLLVS